MTDLFPTPTDPFAVLDTDEPGRALDDAPVADVVDVAVAEAAVPAPEPDPDTPEPAAGKPVPYQGAPSPATIKRIAARTLAVHTAGERTRTLLAALYGVAPEVTAIVAASYAPKGNPWAAAEELASIRAMDPMRAGMTVLGLGRGWLRTAYPLATVLGADLPERVPAKDMDAAITFVTALAATGDWADLLTEARAVASAR